MKSLYIIDIFSFIFRAYYAIRPLSAPDGTPVNAVYGVITMLHKLIQEKKPDHLVICLDSKEGSFRNEIFPEYKANRSEPPEDLVPQIELIKEFIQIYPLTALSKNAFEADDLIATLVKKFKDKKDMQIFIVSSDKDLMQLVSDKDHVVMYDTMKEKIISEKEVVEKFGVGPERVIDIQSLCGDPTDNIPGIPGVGPKTASRLIQDYGSLEAVFDHAEELKGKLKERISQGKADAELSKRLVSLRDDIPLEITWQDLILSEINQDRLNTFYKKLNFKTLISEEASEKKHQPMAETKLSFQAITVSSEEKLKTVLQNYKKTSAPLCFDTETDALDSHQANLVGISFCFEGTQAYYLPVRHKSGKNLDLKHIQNHLGPLLKDKTIPKIAQNAKFDLNVLSRHGFEIQGLKGDTLIASYLINPEGSHNLDTLAQKYLQHETIKFKDLVGKNQNFSDIPIEEAVKYAAEDAWVVFSLYETLFKELKVQGLLKIYEEIEIPLVPLLSKAETYGILVDQKLLQDLKIDFEKRLKALEKKIYKLAGEEFNINSPKQLAEILFGKLKLPTQKKTKTGYSTDVTVLESLAPSHGLPKALLEFRQITKLNSTYVEQLRNLINPKTQRIHTTFNQAVVATGRLSSTDPNLQNIPIKTEEGRKIREVFIAPKDHSLFSADYSQIELRLLADFAKDKRLLEAYQNNEDIHRHTAAHIFGIDLKEVTEEMRSIGKTVNFGVIYGQSPFGLAKQLDIPQSEAKHFIESFYKNYAQVRGYREQVLEEAKKNGYVTTYFGRRRFLPEINSKNFLAKQNAERVAFNAIFQGSAADLIKKAMIEADAFLEKKKLRTKMLLQVHDELIFEVPNSELSEIEKNIPGIMENAFSLTVPIKVSFNHGKNWAEAH